MKKILVFSNREQIGDGIIKLPFIYDVRNRFEDHYFIWMTNSGTTVYNTTLKRITKPYIDEIYEQVPLRNIFLRKNLNNYNLSDNFDIIIDTQKAFIRSLFLKRLKSRVFISSSANWLLSDIKPKEIKNIRKYYLDDLFYMLDLIIPNTKKNDFNIYYPEGLLSQLNKQFLNKNKYIGFAPGSATKERIWNINNFISIANYFKNKNYIPTFFLGPNEINIKNKIISEVPGAFFPEDFIKDYSGPEVVMASSKFLSCSLGNDAGATQMLSCGNSPILKLVGPSNSSKFTPNKRNFYTIDSINYGGKNINLIPVDDVINLMEKIIY